MLRSTGAVGLGQTSGSGMQLEASISQICPSLTCFIMECRAREGKLYFRSIMFKTWQSLEGEKKNRNVTGKRKADGSGQSWGSSRSPPSTVTTAWLVAEAL